MGLYYKDKTNSPIGWGSCRLLQHFPMLDLGPDLPLHGSYAPSILDPFAGQTSIVRWNSGPDGLRRDVSLWTLRILSLVYPSPYYQTCHSCNIRQTRSVVIPCEDYYHGNRHRMQCHDEGSWITVIWQREMLLCFDEVDDVIAKSS